MEWRIAIVDDLKADAEALSAALRERLGGDELHLTPSEYKLLCILARNVGRVLTYRFISREIWGNEWESNTGSLRVFMATLRKKLEKGEKTQSYIQTHVGVGYRMMKL